jgi:hypothetical protein
MRNSDAKIMLLGKRLRHRWKIAARAVYVFVNVQMLSGYEGQMKPRIFGWTTDPIAVLFF